MSKFQFISKLPLLKVGHAYQNFLKKNSKFPSHQSVEQFGVPFVEQGEGYCYFDCNIIYFGQIKLSWYSRWAVCRCFVSYGTYVGYFTTKKNIWSQLTFSGVGGWFEPNTSFWCFAWQIGYGRSTQIESGNSKA